MTSTMMAMIKKMIPCMGVGGCQNQIELETDIKNVPKLIGNIFVQSA